MTQRGAEPVPKACACLVDGRGRLLVFHHPDDGGMQLPKGTVEPGESPEDAVRRELLEESGIDFRRSRCSRWARWSASARPASKATGSGIRSCGTST